VDETLCFRWDEKTLLVFVFGREGTGLTGIEKAEHRDKICVRKIVCAYLTAYTKLGLKCSGSICL